MISDNTNQSLVQAIRMRTEFRWQLLIMIGVISVQVLQVHELLYLRRESISIAHVSERPEKAAKDSKSQI